MSLAELSPESRPRRHPDSSFRTIADEGGLVVLPGKAEVKVLNPVGIKVFGLLDGEHTIREIVEQVLDEFDVSEAQALEDVTAFVGELQQHGMLAAPTRAGGQ